MFGITDLFGFVYLTAKILKNYPLKSARFMEAPRDHLLAFAPIYESTQLAVLDELLSAYET